MKAGLTPIDYLNKSQDFLNKARNEFEKSHKDDYADIRWCSLARTWLIEAELMIKTVEAFEDISDQVK